MAARPALDKRHRKALGRYIRHVADALEMRDWTFVLEHAPCDEELAGHSVSIDGQKHCSLAFAANFLDHPPEEQRETVIHEILHALHATTWRMVQKDLAEPLGKIAYYVYCDSYRRAMEYEVDALSKAFAKHMPLIDWPMPKK